MIKHKIDKMLRKSHFWRDIGFDELSEIYVSNFLRSVSLTLFAVFVLFYLYQLKYPIPEIFALFGFYFMFRVGFDFAAGYFVAWYGPKHSLVVSCVLQIINAVMLLTLPSHMWSVILIALPWGASSSFFFIAQHVMLSKLKTTKRAGQELGHLHIFDKAGQLIGPLLGGIVGSVFGPQYIFLVAVCLLIISLIPLFRSREPVKSRQKLRFKDLNIQPIKKDIISYVGITVENTLCINTWPLYVAVFVLPGAVYAELGALTSIAVAVSILTARLVGRLADTQIAYRLLRLGAVLNAVIYIFRYFSTSIWSVLAINTANEITTALYRLPYMKGLYASADDHPGLRIVYIVSLESTSSVVRSFIWFILALLAYTLSFKGVLFVSFVIAGLASLLIMQVRFRVYNRY